MGFHRSTRSRAARAGVLGSMILLAAAAPSIAEAPEAAVQAEARSPVRSADLFEPTLPDEFVQLEVGETEVVLTNTSDRPINAWVVKKVVRSSQGYEAYATLGVDAYRAPILPTDEDLLLPGESVTFEKGEEPWLREDHRGPGSGVYFEVGALTFHGAEAVGDAEVVERIFERRLEWAKAALAALQATESAQSGDPDALEGLPEAYRPQLDLYTTRDEAVEAIRSNAWEDYSIAVANLRPKDLAELPSGEEVTR